jgi:hypothetical protein
MKEQSGLSKMPKIEEKNSMRDKSMWSNGDCYMHTMKTKDGNRGGARAECFALIPDSERICDLIPSKTLTNSLRYTFVPLFGSSSTISA